MNKCTFLGHADSPIGILPDLKLIITDLITNKGVDTFYVGIEGQFDHMCYKVLKELKRSNAKIHIYRVLAYMPRNDEHSEYSIFPENIETVPKRFAISWRNKWMINNSDYVVTHVTRNFGGASKFKEFAFKRGKIIINID